MKRSLIGIVLALMCPLPFAEAAPEDESLFEQTSVSRPPSRLAPARTPRSTPAVVPAPVRPHPWAVPIAAVDAPPEGTPRLLSRPPPL